MPQWDKSWEERTDAEKLEIALHTQELMHKKIGGLRRHLNAVMDKNKLLRKQVRKLQQRINELNAQVGLW